MIKPTWERRLTPSRVAAAFAADRRTEVALGLRFCIKPIDFGFDAGGPVLRGAVLP